MSSQPRRGISALLDSTIGNKLLMALTGLGLVGFLVMHMAGNLLVLAGRPEPINEYGAKLYSLGPLLWVARLGLLGLFVTHMALAIRLTLKNKAARPQGYEFEKTLEASWASRYMIVTGLIILVFVVLHLAHFTLGLIGPGTTFKDAHKAHDVYTMVLVSFRNPAISGAYVLVMAALGTHLFHGFASLWRSIGITHEGFVAAMVKASIGLASVLFLGQAVVPLAVLAGVIKPLGGAL